MDSASAYSSFFIRYWSDFQRCVDSAENKAIDIDGHSLDIASLVASARHCNPATISSSACQQIEDSASIIGDSLVNGMVIYGVNTGFGGSADTRTSAVEELQATLMDELHYGIIASNSQPDFPVRQSGRDRRHRKCLTIDNSDLNSCMPESWARASMLVRLNSLSSGASGVRLSMAQTLATLISKNIVPLIPLRGSISASGDLSPLSYIAGAVQGKRSIRVWADNPDEPDQRRITSADRALKSANVAPITLGPKEGLALVNGTAVSTGVAALALHEAHAQIALSQVLTAMTVEALLGTDDSFDPFIAKVRPHPGQIDSARCIYKFLASSKLVYRNDGKEDMTLRQDRYSIRTASQWIGPVMEDILLAHHQITVELNSVTDNPLIDTREGNILHGGNFQAKSVTSAVEKVRQGVQSVGRMLFAQCTELINHTMSRGLPANLVADEPSESMVWKGTDIYIASLASELGFLANPVGSHVMTAEMGNQSLNSLALISTRYTLTALEVLTQLSALHLMAICQALDARALQHLFHSRLQEEFHVLKKALLKTLRDEGLSLQETEVELIFSLAWKQFLRTMEQSMNMDSLPRIAKAANALWPTLIKAIPESTLHAQTIQDFISDLTNQAAVVWESSKAEYRSKPDATPLISDAAKRLYRFVRQVLGVPYMGRGGVDVSATENPQDKDEGDQESEDMPPTVGTYLTRIYESMRSGELYSEVAACFEDVTESRPKRKRDSEESSDKESSNYKKRTEKA